MFASACSSSESSPPLWATPNAPDGGRGIPAGADPFSGTLVTTTGRKVQIGLEAQASLWSTPKASDAEKGGPNQRDGKGRAYLPSQAATWPTPNAVTGGANSNREARRAGGPDLQEAAQLWPTPAARDWRDDGGAPAASARRSPCLPARASRFTHPALGTRTHGVSRSRGTPASLPRLNPRFAAWLMGWPPDWTNPSRSARTSFGAWATASIHMLRRRLSYTFSLN